MSYSGSIQWSYQPDEEIIKKAKKTKLLSGLAVFGGIIFIAYSDIKEAIEHYSLADLSSNIYVYIIIIYGILWFVSINKRMALKDETFAINSEYLEIIDETSGKIKQYEWEKLASFSTDTKYFKRENLNVKYLPSDELILINLKPKSLAIKTQLYLPVPKSRRTEVIERLKNKLPEKIHGQK
jgi:hypothetical protein